MHVFGTGATGWIGPAVVDDLFDAGHEATGPARSRRLRRRPPEEGRTGTARRPRRLRQPRGHRTGTQTAHHLDHPDDTEAHFGFVSHSFGQTLTATSTITRPTLAWNPSGPTLIEDVLTGAYRWAEYTKEQSCLRSRTDRNDVHPGADNPRMARPLGRAASAGFSSPRYFHRSTAR